VDIIPVTTGYPVPTPAQLRAYQSVPVYSDQGFNDNVGLGNVLADYLDQGGGLAPATFAYWNSDTLSIQGRLVSGGYLPFTTAGQANPGYLTLVKDLPSHPRPEAAGSFNGGSSSFQTSSIGITAGTTQVVHWSNGRPLVGAEDIGAGHFAGLNFFPPSSDARSDLWVSSTDGARLMADALLWSGKIAPTLLSAPADQVIPPGATAGFQVVAAGTSPLGYQWRLNGTNLPAATNSTLTFTVQPGSPGAYSVVVSNLYGTTTSLNVMLNPKLRFLPPVVAGGTFSLFLVGCRRKPRCSQPRRAGDHLHDHESGSAHLRLDAVDQRRRAKCGRTSRRWLQCHQRLEPVFPGSGGAVNLICRRKWEKPQPRLTRPAQTLLPRHRGRSLNRRRKRMREGRAQLKTPLDFPAVKMESLENLH
jgi:hypothetical protein